MVLSVLFLVLTSIIWLNVRQCLKFMCILLSCNFVSGQCFTVPLHAQGDLGITGPTGIEGPEGEKGSHGDQGPPGISGKDGSPVS